MIFKALKPHLANILTFKDMILGLGSILLSIQEEYILSAIIIIVAVLTDIFDGLVACKLNIESILGKFLDSNSDLIPFGVALELLFYLSILHRFTILRIIFLFFFIMAGSLRLAKYNAIEFKGYYVYIPIDIAGALLA